MRLRSGSEVLERSLSSGKQDYDTDRNIWPVNKPIPKLESIYQTSGEGQYANDIPLRSNEVFCAFVLTDIHKGKIESIDASAALVRLQLLTYCESPAVTYIQLPDNQTMPSIPQTSQLAQIIKL